MRTQIHIMTVCPRRIRLLRNNFEPFLKLTLTCLCHKYLSVVFKLFSYIGRDKSDGAQAAYDRTENVMWHAIRQDSHENSPGPTSPYVTVVGGTNDKPDIGVTASRW